MFIFQRPLLPVAAALGVVLLLVCLDRLCQPPDPPPAVVSHAADGRALVP
jgi:hypothetical protein